MSEKITPEITKKVAALSRLDLSEEEVKQFSSQLSSVLQHADDMEALDLTDIEPTSHPYPLKNVLRDDVVASQDEKFKEDVLEAAPDSEDEQFKVPSILG